MKNNYYSFGLVAALLFGVSNSMNAQWTKKYLPSQFWPSNDVKSYNSALYVAANSGVFKSTDDGGTWTDLTKGFAASSTSGFRELVFITGGNIYVRTTTEGVLRSMNGGTSWEYDTAGIGGSDVQSIFYDNGNDRLFIGLPWPDYGLWTKKPSDPKWVRITSSAFASNLVPTQITRNGSNLYIIDNAKKAYESTDNGTTWTKKLSTGLSDVSTSQGATRFLSIDNELYVAGSGIYKSSNGGDNWTRIDTGFQKTSGIFVDCRSLYYDGTNLYSSVWSGGNTYRSPDKGNTWIKTGATSTFLISYATHNNTLYAAGYGSDTLFVYGQGMSGLVNPYRGNLSVIISPNPSDQILEVQFNAALQRESKFDLFDPQGKLIKTEILKQGSKIYHICNESVQSGTYLIRLSNGEKVITKNIIISHK